MSPKTLATLIVLLCAGCGATPASDPARRAEAPPRPWTRAFSSPAILIADEIVVEGSGDLLAHVASRQDPTTTSYSSRTTAEGLRQETTVRADAGGAEITAQLDAWELHALRRLVVLQRFDDAPVTLRASGNAYWVAADGRGERRAAALSFGGEPGG